MRRTTTPAPLSPAMEDYLRVIHELSAGGAPVHNCDIAARLGVAAPSATDMVRRLAAGGYAEHPLHGTIRLTTSGRAIAEDLAQRHSLIRAYLVAILGFAPNAAAREADRLEHVLSTTLRTRLAAATPRE